jgi:hypothetical protein
MPRIVNAEENINKFFCFKTALELLKFNRIKKEGLEKR